jgi:hypothetical protein
VTSEQFVVCWQSSKSVAGVASKLRMPAAVASDRASKYRRRGVPLKLMSRFVRKLDVAALRCLAAGLLEPNHAESV